ncbi:hypothetical protein [Blackberry virus F]|uniref:P1 n=2 Tax=Blackberry virus F TaxID=2560349 RepID=A0A0X8TLD2_9VIRU|nr:hypothetical protein [Blackberry virus F]AHX37577.1 hypothetical protein [Blackberry virus F]
MTAERIEQSIKDWDDKYKVKDLDYLNLEVPQPSSFQNLSSLGFFCFHQNCKHSLESSSSQLNLLTDLALVQHLNLEFTHSRVGLSARIAIKYFHSISNQLKEQEEQLKTVAATQKKIQKQLKSLEGELEQHRPLSRTDVQQLVQEIAQQPKLVEAEALRLTQDLERRLNEVKDLLGEVKKALLS